MSQRIRTPESEPDLLGLRRDERPRRLGMLALPARATGTDPPLPDVAKARAVADVRRCVGPDRAGPGPWWCLGASRSPRGSSLGLVIVVLPAWAVAEMIAHRRRNRGLPTSTTRKVVWIVVLAVVIPILLGVALFIAFWLICLIERPR